ncbi:MAG: 3'(2'),5'-bisphosphate nucleotidase [Thermodesulfobacteriota bacterium]|nr:3'(2'),5'-bisphosphate nucleotidase [Thermodesulfobacteriota bacterium]
MKENSLEVITALQAIRMASRLCQKVRKKLAEGGSIQKSDRSPVTIADYGSQAIICKLIKEAFPDDIVVAEEDSAELRKPDHSSLLNQVTEYIHDFFPGASSDEICSWIELSSHLTQNRFWTLDPIDGTKGFLRGDQYAIALALIENGSVQLGLMACPNLYVDIDHPFGEKGCLFVASKGKGSFQMDNNGVSKRTLSVSKVKRPSEAIITESVEPDHADHLTHQRLAKRLNISKPSLRMDSQAKYGIVARGEATFYIRVPSSSEPDYKENIWDHASGAIIAEEAGGKVTDLYGKPLDFSGGIKLERNHGILVSNGILHEVILKVLEM